MTTTWRETASTALRDGAGRYGRNDLPAILALAAFSKNALSPAQVAEGIEDAWTSAEWPLKCLESEIWYLLFERATPRDHYLLEAEPRPLSELPEKVTLYRGAAEGYEYGMSWTDNLESAQWFANRFGNHHQTNVWSITVPRERVLARFHEGRGEHEWVLDNRELNVFETVLVEKEAVS